MSLVSIRRLPRPAVGRVSALAVFILAIGVAFLTLACATGARAADVQQVDIGQYETSRFVRIGVDKAAVVRLPLPASDVLVGNPEVVDAVVRTPHAIYLFAKRTGQTNVFVFDTDGHQTLSLDIEVAHDSAALRHLIARVMPDAAIAVETVGDNVVLTGTARNAAEARRAVDLAARFTGDENKVVNTLSIAAKEQVLLRVRVVEVQRAVLKQLGVDTRSLFSIGKATFDVLTANPFSIASSGALSASGAAGEIVSGGDVFGATLRAMERDGLMRTLAEPTLTAITGESAKFLAGGEFPVPVKGDDDGVTVQFKPFGVGLGFTPVVLGAGRISMRVSTEVSELSTEQSVNMGTGTDTLITIPSLKVRRAETTVELPSGGSLVMAGLIQEQMRQDINGIPGLKNIPILGALFRSRDFQRSETELVVIVTPFIVDSVNDKQLTMPDKRLNYATDAQTILFGQLHKVYGTAGRKPQGTWHGHAGFIVE